MPEDRRCARACGPRKRFMKAHGKVFWVLGIMQYFWYSSDKRREKFVSICADKDVQRLTWESYMNKELVRRDPLAHVRIFFKDLAHLGAAWTSTAPWLLAGLLAHLLDLWRRWPRGR
jgi:hypothetical protein